MRFTVAVRLLKPGSEYNRIVNADGSFLYSGFFKDVDTNGLVSMYFPKGFDLSKYEAGTTFIVDVLMSPSIYDDNGRPIPTYRMYALNVKTAAKNKGGKNVRKTD